MEEGLIFVIEKILTFKKKTPNKALHVISKALSREDFSAQGLLQSTLDILIPQAIDQWVEHGHHSSIKNRGQFPLIQGQTRRWLEVHKCS